MMLYILQAVTQAATATATPSASTDWGQRIPELIGLATIISGVVGGIIGAYYKPLIGDYLDRRQLRLNLYRELVNFYELTKWCIKALEREANESYITTTFLDALYPTNDCIAQSLENPQILRDDLLWLLHFMDFYIKELRKGLTENNFFHAVQTEPERLRVFYQLDESSALYEAFQDFLIIETEALDQHYPAPSCRLLTQDDADELYALEYRFSLAKKACYRFEKKEDSEELDSALAVL
ncbi:MAG: hypothetical protein ACXV3D_07865 [Halobacteriota archaeon]